MPIGLSDGTKVAEPIFQITELEDEDTTLTPILASEVYASASSQLIAVVGSSAEDTSPIRPQSDTTTAKLLALDNIAFVRIFRATAAELISQYLGERITTPLSPDTTLIRLTLPDNCLLSVDYTMKKYKGGNFRRSQVVYKIGTVRVQLSDYTAVALGLGMIPREVWKRYAYNQVEASHLCGNADCINPKDLRNETHSINMSREKCFNTAFRQPLRDFCVKHMPPCKLYKRRFPRYIQMGVPEKVYKAYQNVHNNKLMCQWANCDFEGQDEMMVFQHYFMKHGDSSTAHCAKEHEDSDTVPRAREQKDSDAVPRARKQEVSNAVPRARKQEVSDAVSRARKQEVSGTTSRAKDDKIANSSDDSQNNISEVDEFPSIPCQLQSCSVRLGSRLEFMKHAKTMDGRGEFGHGMYFPPPGKDGLYPCSGCEFGTKFLASRIRHGLRFGWRDHGTPRGC